MYHAYGTYQPKKPAWKVDKRPRWPRRGSRPVLILLAALIAATVLLAWNCESVDHRRSQTYKTSLQRSEGGKVPPDQTPSSLEVVLEEKPSGGDTPSLGDSLWLHNHMASIKENHVEHGRGRDSQQGPVRHDEEEEEEASAPLEQDEAPSRNSKKHPVVSDPIKDEVTKDKVPVAAAAQDPLEGEVETAPAPPREPPVEELVEDESNESEQHLSLEQQAESLPEFVWVPFHEAVKNEVLQGWEDEWVSSGTFDEQKWGKLEEPRVDFAYLWVNGSEEDFQRTIRVWEERSVLNDPDGKWISSHGVNRYRDWDELRYSFRSIEKNAGNFTNTVKVLVNSIYQDGVPVRKQTPSWLAVADPEVARFVQVVPQEDMFEADKAVCLPTFNSLTIENQIFNTQSDVDQFVALSDDMLLTREHSAADVYSPLFGSVLSFKTNGYSTTSPPTEVDARRFGEKPYLIYTSWLLNRRFGTRKRKGQSHFGHSLSRSIMREAIEAFPRPEIQSACKRFRGEPGFQLYSWYATYHYLIERHREVLLWSYIMLRSDVDRNGVLSWSERQTILGDLAAGAQNARRVSFRRKIFYHVPFMLEKAGLRAPQVNTNSLWTSLDGPLAIRDADCAEFDLDECLAPGFGIGPDTSESIGSSSRNPAFSSAAVFDRLARQIPRCGDCLVKRLLQQTSSGLGPLLPHAETESQRQDRELVVKAVMRYKYVVVDPSDTLFVMVTDADQIDSTLYRPFVHNHKQLPGQLCLNDDVATTDEHELRDVQTAMRELLQALFPEKSRAELPL
ncbi:hypothetical protein A1O3_06198 [Capronia epimyces CBS 606.96]|uniref:Stealth protein CR2 conserved region 2 domain-containing protein n=1 Tax=Capronia epimyces CBS 606.96 TaxID=1182542 RepID=W9XYG4_9EURO|nr:uncharacterized protein A1O3_06198 [Capronia epimyces CBS 606.96]EXJ82385.1 hypothetical protein A1O3_06198 [Capronia epimyces CBS 606.96]